MSENPVMERRYTLNEARRELARKECAMRGHDWDVLETFGSGPPSRIVCTRCGVSYRVEAGAEASNART